VDSPLNQLSSSVGDRTNAANHAVARACLANPSLLEPIGGGLLGDDKKLAGDCAEVMTQTAAEAPELVVPYAGALIKLLEHPYTRARWEAAHALADIASLVPEQLRKSRDLLVDLIRHDSSIIVRDYSVDIVSGLAGASVDDAAWAFPILQECLDLWDGRHAGHSLPGLGRVAEHLPHHRAQIRRQAEGLQDHQRGVVRKAAKRLVRKLS
jgi:hypothetical protein